MPRGSASQGAVEGTVGAYLDAVDVAVPGLVDRLYVVGSAALGAWQAGHSDIDTVIFTSRVPAANDLAALRAVHATSHARPHLGGAYLSPQDGWPTDNRVVPHVVDGEFHTDRPCGELNPVLWLILQRYGIAVRGPAVAGLGVMVDLPALRAYNLDNLRTYWQAQADRILRSAPDLEPAAEMNAEYVTWVTLGPARLHYTLATEDVVSKPAAGDYVIAHFPDYEHLARRAVRWRAGSLETFTAADLVAAAELTNVIADDAWRRWE